MAARLSKMMAGFAYYAAAAVWKRSSRPRPRPPRPLGNGRASSSSFHAAAAAWERSGSPSDLLLPRRPLLPPRFIKCGVFGNYRFHRTLSTEVNKCCCERTLQDSRIEGFMYDDYDPPESISWRKLGAVTPVQDQLVSGPFWAFAATGAIEGINAKQTGNLIKLSEQQIIDCNYLGNGGYEGGQSHMAFDYVVRNGGLVPQSVYPSVGKQCPCRKIWSHMVTIDGYQFVPRNDEPALQKAVANQPVVADICLNETLREYKGGIAYDHYGKQGELNHSVLIVWFDKTSKGEKFWIVKDSAGTKRGKKGFVLISGDSVRVGGAFGIAKSACYPVKLSQNCEGFVDDDVSLYHKLYCKQR